MAEILSCPCLQYRKRRSLRLECFVDVDAADEDEVELDDELDESGGDVLVEGV